MNNNQKLIFDLLETKPIAFNPALVRVTKSIGAALLLSQLLYWQGKGARGAWIYKTIAELDEETALTRREQVKAIDVLKKIGIVEMRLMGVPAKRHFRLNMDKLVLCLESYKLVSTREIASNQGQISCTNKFVHKKQPQNEAKLAVQTNTESTTNNTTLYSSIMDEMDEENYERTPTRLKEQGEKSEKVELSIQEPKIEPNTGGFVWQEPKTLGGKTSLKELTDLELWEMASYFDMQSPSDVTDKYKQVIEILNGENMQYGYKSTWGMLKSFIQRDINRGIIVIDQHPDFTNEYLLKQKHPKLLAEWYELRKSARENGWI